MDSKGLKDRMVGCLVGGAVGDALGYEVEFDWYERIVAKYGLKGITRYELDRKGVAEISDDTQMTLFTADGLLNAIAKRAEGECRGTASGELAEGEGFGHEHPMSHRETSFILNAYLDWYRTQTERFGAVPSDGSRLMGVEALYSRRAPGNTCLSSLNCISSGKKPFNNSKGCGGIMRVAPIALYGAALGRDAGEMAELGCEAARLTHLHPLGWLPAGLLVYVVQKVLLHEGAVAREDLVAYVYEGLGYLESRTDWNVPQADYDVLRAGTQKAILLADSATGDVAAIGQLGEGWVGDEAWFIALYCALKHFDSFEDAVVAAVNHNGDSDSTGAVAGNLMGAVHGYAAIPEHYTADLELRDLIVSTAVALHDAGRE